MTWISLLQRMFHKSQVSFNVNERQIKQQSTNIKEWRPTISTGKIFPRYADYEKLLGCSLICNCEATLQINDHWPVYTSLKAWRWSIFICCLFIMAEAFPKIIDSSKTHCSSHNSNPCSSLMGTSTNQPQTLWYLHTTSKLFLKLVEERTMLIARGVSSKAVALQSSCPKPKRQYSSSPLPQSRCLFLFFWLFYPLNIQLLS